MAASKPAATKPTPKKAASALAVPADGGSFAMFKTYEDNALVPIQGGGGVSPYVQFAHPQAKNYGNMVAALGKIDEGTPIYVDGNEFTLLDPFAFIASPAWHQYYADIDGDGQIIAAQSFENRKPKDWVDLIDAVLLVVINDEIKPARIRCRGPKCPMYRDAHNRNIEATAKEWPGESKDNALAASSKLPSWMWLTHSVAFSTHNPRKAVTADGQKKKPYIVADSSAKATKAIVLNELRKRMVDNEFKEVLQACMDEFTKTKEEIETLF